MFDPSLSHRSRQELITTPRADAETPLTDPAPPRVVMVTIGQTPRDDLVPEIVAALPRPVEVHEWGALDGLTREQIADLAPGEDDHALVTRLRNGSQAVIGKRWVTGRIQECLDARATAGWHGSEATVLLCTGDFSELLTRGLFLDAQHPVCTR